MGQHLYNILHAKVLIFKPLIFILIVFDTSPGPWWPCALKRTRTHGLEGRLVRRCLGRRPRRATRRLPMCRALLPEACPNRKSGASARSGARRRGRVAPSTRRTKPLRGGEDRDLVSERSASATRPTVSDSAPCLYQRAMPCSAFASARPTRPGVRPRSATALRIQDSAEDELGRDGKGTRITPGRNSSLTSLSASL